VAAQKRKKPTGRVSAPPVRPARRSWAPTLIALSLALVAAAIAAGPAARWRKAAAPEPAATPSAQNETPVDGYEIVKVFPHDRRAFTQGLVIADGFLYEGTGQHGQSSIRRIRLETGEVLAEHKLGAEYFGEGIAAWGPLLMQLTYKTQVGFVYDRATFKLRTTFHYAGEGWGLTADSRRLIMSDGTQALRFLDPDLLKETGRLTVMDRGEPVVYLNELEFVRGEIYANVWQTSRVARIDPDTGHVTRWIDLSGLLTDADRAGGVDVLNGIAHDPATDRLFVTGKLWPKLFEIRIVQRR
jgi:glutaminyl-peptide cyclotransferase